MMRKNEAVMMARRPSVWRGVLVLCLLLAIAFTAGGSWAAETPQQALPDNVPGAPGYVPPVAYKAGELLVGYKEGVAATAGAAVMEAVGATYVRALPAAAAELWQVPEGQEEALARELSADPLIAFAEPNYAYHVFNTVPNDSAFGQQWGHQRMDSPAGWDITVGNNSIVIAVLDTGVDLGHPDLAAKYVPGYDFVNGDGNPVDGFGHGTHVAGIAAAVTNNGYGVAGVSWGARIMPVQVLNSEGSGFSSWIIDGINYAYTNGAKILNLSLGGPSYSQGMQNAVNSANAAGSLVVAAMGNDRLDGNPTQYPAAYNNVLAVASTGPGDQYSFFSQYGSHNDVAAPGGEMSFYGDPNGILSTMPTYEVTMTQPPFGYQNNFDYVHGTSQATPQVAGLASLIWTLQPGYSPDQVQQVIEDTAEDLGAPGWDSTYGHGRINVYQALSAIAQLEPPVLLPILNLDGNGNYTVDWTDVSGATSYVLQEDDNPAFASPATVYSGPNSAYAVANASPGWHYYRVQAIGSGTESDWSATRSTQVVPVAPALLAISNGDGDGEYTVNWNAAAGAAAYVLQEDDNPAFSSPKVRYIGTALSYEVTGQTDDTWYYRVAAYNGAGVGGWSNTQSTVVDPAVLDAPVLNAISNEDSNGDYTVDWDAVPGATGYILEISDNRFFNNPQVLYSGANTQYNETNQPFGTWYYRVRATAPGGDSPWSNEDSATVGISVYLPLILK